jgi:biotin carboxyl carrier protein
MPKTQYTIAGGGDQQTLVVDGNGRSFVVSLDAETIELDVQRVGPREYHVLFGNRSLGFAVEGDIPKLTVHHAGNAFPVELLDERWAARRATQGSSGGRAADGTVAITAPMPGKVVKRLVDEGEQVVAGQGVIVVEAMKMENELRAAVDGTVKRFKVAEGDNVEAGECLVLIE